MLTRFHLHPRSQPSLAQQWEEGPGSPHIPRGCANSPLTDRTEQQMHNQSRERARHTLNAPNIELARVRRWGRRSWEQEEDKETVSGRRGEGPLSIQNIKPKLYVICHQLTECMTSGSRNKASSISPKSFKNKVLTCTWRQNRKQFYSIHLWP